MITLGACKSTTAKVDNSDSSPTYKELKDPRGTVLKSTATGEIKPQMVDTLYSPDEVIVAERIPTNMGYAVDPTGNTDSTDFEITLKRNIYNSYCSQPAFELIAYIFRDEGVLVFDWLKQAKKGSIPEFKEQMSEITQRFMDTPLKDMRMDNESSASEIFLEAAQAISELAGIF